MNDHNIFLWDLIMRVNSVCGITVTTMIFPETVKTACCCNNAKIKFSLVLCEQKRR